jgi:anti-sigma regulatory factor (Ser/Thr protein kinase)
MEGEFRAALRADPSAAAQARSITRDVLARWELASIAETACLLLSELVANVVRHGAWPSELTIGRRPGRIHVAVSDRGPHLPRRAHPSVSAPSGRGLALVEDIAASWGCVPLDDGKVVWFELPFQPRSGSSPGTARSGAPVTDGRPGRARRQDAWARMASSAGASEPGGRARWALCDAHTAVPL